MAKRDFAAPGRRTARRTSWRRPDMEPVAGLVAWTSRQKNPDDAVKRVDALLAARRPGWSAALLGARVYARDRQARPGRSDCSNAPSRPIPTRWSPTGCLGNCTPRRDDWPKRAPASSAMHRTQPDSVAAHTMVAVLYEMQGNRAEARKRYERVLQIDSRAPVAANNLAYIYAEEGGNLDVALQLAQTAKQKLPDVPEVTDTVGWVYYKKDLPGLAIPLFEQALAKAPDQPDLPLSPGPRAPEDWRQGQGARGPRARW